MIQATYLSRHKRRSIFVATGATSRKRRSQLLQKATQSTIISPLIQSYMRGFIFDSQQVNLAMYLCNFRNCCLLNVNTYLCKHQHQHCWDLVNLHRVQSTWLLWETLPSPRDQMKMPIKFLEKILKTFLYPINNQISQLYKQLCIAIYKMMKFLEATTSKWEH
jgi:hypothetical protein